MAIHVDRHIDRSMNGQTGGMKITGIFRDYMRLYIKLNEFIEI